MNALCCGGGSVWPRLRLITGSRYSLICGLVFWGWGGVGGAERTQLLSRGPGRREVRAARAPRPRNGPPEGRPTHRVVAVLVEGEVGLEGVERPGVSAGSA
jgi:hypothetical protein